MDILELLKRAQKGDREAYAELFGQYEGDLYRAAYIYVGNPDDALDVVQETAYRSYKSIRGLKEPRYFKTWLVKIAIRCAMDVYRKRRNEAAWKPAYEETLLAEEETDVPLAISLQALLELLDVQEKQVVLLRYYYDLTIREVSEVMELPLGTAKTMLYRALAKLKRRAGEEGQDAYR
ncbi:sigma-70 family RNA polymerase sigma factor [Cohnella ginsengisoli]|uniref:Sigma-70 family RNA polymerase sigma factor n=2 Tax=Cohnella ginsengisoli TaxID=425004 RepID=A0A9X4KLQ4_9BACL|nr:sigma-70 family RNA polymerase sigma factor [Cohnella ginsengisoli]MDG0794101.1 sigma-70 family RNA polymerase sigma factor [Cohnella ginsengisoli]